MLDLRIRGKKALVCAASKGLGRACATALGRAGVELAITARTAETLEQTAEEIRKETGAKVTPVAGDISTEAGRAAALAACPAPDILVNNCGGPPHGDFREWSVEDWQKAAQRQHVDPDHADQGGGRRHVRAAIWPDRQHHLGLGQIADPQSRHEQRCARRFDRVFAGLARQVAKYNVTINGLLPGPFLTDRSALRHRIRGAAAEYLVRGDARPSAVRSNPTGRVGDPAEFGDACAFLCAASSGFIVGQNLLLDGGAFNSTMG